MRLTAKWDNQSQPIVQPGAAPAAAGQAGSSDNDTEIEPEQPVAPQVAQLSWTLYQCMDLQCVCPYLNGRLSSNGACTLPNGQLLQKSHRKEYRHLTEDERNRLHDAFWEIKHNGLYDHLAQIHRIADRDNASAPEGSGGAHSGPAFLPWHREFIKRIELALRLVDPTVSLAYIDWTMEAALNKPNDSILFSKYLQGEIAPRGSKIINGPFVGWKTLDGSRNVNRSMGTLGTGIPITEEQMERMMRKDYLGWFSFPIGRRGCEHVAEFESIEYFHGNAHVYVGGDMSDIPTAVQDPIFFWHHSFVDWVWETWRQNQTVVEREREYPPVTLECANAHHQKDEFMLPFTPFRNQDGLSERYANNLVTYANRPMCSADNTDGCNSDFLFCDLSHGKARCVSKLKPRARCNYYSRGENPCFAGECLNGVCIQTERRNPARPKRFPSGYKSKMIVQEMCFNLNPCCMKWAKEGYCHNNPWYMHKFCPTSCKLCTPTKYTLADDCKDRHILCSQWKKKGECARNADWMNENCRKSCDCCSRTRAQECRDSNSKTNTNSKTNLNNRGNNHENNRARTPSKTPQACADYSVHCPYWKNLGECERNTWMSPTAPLAKEIKWMKSHRRSGLIDGWQGSSRDWNRLSVDAQNYGARHDQQNSRDAHPTVPSYKPDIKKNTWGILLRRPIDMGFFTKPNCKPIYLAIYGSIFLVWVICLLKNIVMWSDYEDIKEKEAVKDAIFYQQLILSIFGAKCIFFTFKRDGAWSQDRRIPIYSPLMNAGDWFLYIVYIIAIYFTFALMIIVYTQIRKEDKAAEEAKKAGEAAKPINSA
ncbi:hypothetical protein WR25_06614 [Diploscapter pachys]|uniref:ShKT domain-containing protein n=1 Tax=Diploscapter pachys TaxID=2018661 RepID=A0A2A2L189_9BILA|nr:hypothetical protein WR25_06614 [Diploscapter pachys]